MSTFPSAPEVRRGMKRFKDAHEQLETLLRAQIAQAVFGASVNDRVRVAQAVVVALGYLNEATVLYLALMGLQEGEEFQGVVDAEAF